MKFFTKSSDQRERVVTVVRQHRSGSGPVAQIYARIRSELVTPLTLKPAVDRVIGTRCFLGYEYSLFLQMISRRCGSTGSRNADPTCVGLRRAVGFEIPINCVVVISDSGNRSLLGAVTHAAIFLLSPTKPHRGMPPRFSWYGASAPFDKNVFSTT